MNDEIVTAGADLKEGYQSSILYLPNPDLYFRCGSMRTPEHRPYILMRLAAKWICIANNALQPSRELLFVRGTELDSWRSKSF